MIYNQHDWDQDGKPVLDQDLNQGYGELAEGIELSAAEKRFVWVCIAIGLLALVAIFIYCVTYEPPT